MDSSKKSKPVTTSVPSIAIRFNANAQELEVETTQQEEYSEEEVKTPKLSTRSTSVDNNSSEPPWKLFSKFSKTVEEKFRHQKQKEGSSVSASEEEEESSLSKTYGIISTTEGVESTSSENEADIDSDILGNTTECKTKPSKSEESMIESGIEVLEDTQLETKPGFVDLRSSTTKAKSWNFYRPMKWLVLFLTLFMYGLAPLPVYLSGFLSGALVILGTWWITGVAVPKPRSIVEVAAAVEHQPVKKMEGWMNELPEEYDPTTYHISKTQSVLVRLQADRLRLSHTRQKIARRATWNEMKNLHINFTNHRLYDLRGASITLLPLGLAKKRHWSKKYPICITLMQAGLPDKDLTNKSGEEDEEEESDIDDVAATSWHLYLFARTDREKEDWYRKLCKATGTHEAKDESEYTRLTRITDQLWIDALISRLIFSAIRDESFKLLIQERVQKKLQTLRLPYFIEELVVSDLNFGCQVPRINNVASPVWDDRGLWIDLDIDYKGLVTVILETKLNLMKLKQSGLMTKSPQKDNRRSAMFDSDLEDSAESSSDCESHQPHTDSETSSAKFLKMVDRIAANKYFQHATDLVYVKKAMEGVSKTELKLKVELQSLSGTLVLNLPPWSSDRLWVGFRPVPKVQLQAVPAVGERSISFQHVTGWIENKLLTEFQKLLVVPNMEDFIVPFKSGL